MSKSVGVGSILDRLLLRYSPVQSPSARFLRRMMGVPGWAVGPMWFEDRTLKIAGWAVSPRATDGQPTLLVNGRPVESLSWQPRSDIDRLFWYVPEVRRRGFSGHFPIGKIIHNGDVIEMAASWRMRGGQTHELPSFFLRWPEADGLPLPDDKRRMRVHGDADESAFRLIGYTSVSQLDVALRRGLKRPLGSFERILDWGCGCGRLTRYLTPIKGTVTGVDIDADNIAWCSAHLPFARFQHIAPDPPIPIEAGSVDLVIGISIFTHLNEDDQFSWLRELRRVLSPTGVAAVTVSGNAAVARSGVPVSMVTSWLQAGFLDVGRNTDLDGAVDQPDRYRNVFHSPDYIAAKWPPAGFRIAHTSPAAIGGHQDLVLLQPV